jgi:DNA-binding transcriptional MerR regulator
VFVDAYTLPQLSKMVGTPYRTLHSWVERGVLRPSVHRVKGTGRANLFDERDAFTVLVLAELREAGVKLELLRRAAERLSEADDVMATPVYLLVNGDVEIVRTGQEATEALVRGGLTVAYYTGPAIERVTTLQRSSSEEPATDRALAGAWPPASALMPLAPEPCATTTRGRVRYARSATWSG